MQCDIVYLYSLKAKTDIYLMINAHNIGLVQLIQYNNKKVNKYRKYKSKYRDNENIINYL